MNILKKAIMINNHTKITAHHLLNRLYCCASRSSTVKEIMTFWKTRFENSDIPEADISIRLIISHVLGIKRIDYLDHIHSRTLNVEEETHINRCCECRLVRVPVQYIIKEWEFRDSVLTMQPPVFIPRPETEMLIDIVKESTADDDLKTGLEVGCGTGAISISLLKEYKELQMTAIDQSRLACNLTTINAKQNKVDNRLKVFQRKLEDNGEIDDFEINHVDIIISNPPYLFSNEIPQLPPEIKLYEDLRSLDGGSDGLRVIKAILQFSSKLLGPRKSCFLEVHNRHVPMIKSWLDQNFQLNLVVSGTFKDFSGYEIFIRITKVK